MARFTFGPINGWWDRAMHRPLRVFPHLRLPCACQGLSTPYPSGIFKPPANRGTMQNRAVNVLRSEVGRFSGNVSPLRRPASRSRTKGPRRRRTAARTDLRVDTPRAMAEGWNHKTPVIGKTEVMPCGMSACKPVRGLVQGSGFGGLKRG